MFSQLIIMDGQNYEKKNSYQVLSNFDYTKSTRLQANIQVEYCMCGGHKLKKKLLHFPSFVLCCQNLSLKQNMCLRTCVAAVKNVKVKAITIFSCPSD